MLGRAFTELFNRLKVIVLIDVLLRAGLFAHLSEQKDHPWDLLSNRLICSENPVY